MGVSHKNTLSGIFLLVLANTFPLAAAVDWKPVTPVELSQKTPKVDPAADAEAIFWDVRVEDRVSGGEPQTVLNHYLRIKIYSAQGKESQGTVEIASANKVSITDVAGRTLKQNGQILDVPKESIFERDLVKTKGGKLKGKTFAFPGVEPGDLVEFRWRETRRDTIANYIRLYLQRDIPVWQVKYSIKPLTAPDFPFGMRGLPRNCANPAFIKEKDGFYSFSLNDMPAYREEPRMPPEDEVKAWLLLYYSDDQRPTAEKYWKEYAKERFNEEKPYLKADDDIKRLAAELISGAATPDEKLDKLDTHCRTKVKNVWWEGYGVTAEQRNAMKPNKSPSQTLKQGMGTGRDIALLFAALAGAAGFETHVTRVADRGDTFFNPKQIANGYFLGTYNVAVKSGDRWRFFDPGTPFLEKDMLRWQEEGVMALMLDAKEGTFVQTPALPPERSLRKRRAKLQLLEDGTLEGSVRIEYSGHAAQGIKARYAGKNEAQRLEDWKEGVVGRLSTAEVRDLKLENLDSHSAPFAASYKVKVPGYAQRTGRRLFLQPAFFQRNVAAEFAATQRTHDVYFAYGWAEDDEVAIELPEGWALDQPSAPGSSPLGGVGEYKTRLAQTENGRTIHYFRNFRFGDKNQVLFPVKAYPTLKQIFDFIHEQDNHAITLKQAAR